MSLFERMLGESNELPPTNQQLAYARDLGLEIKPGMSLDDVSRLISQAKTHCPPTEEQLQYAQEFDIDISPEMSLHEVESLIRETKSSGLPTEHQIADAMAHGIKIRDDMSYAEVNALIRKAETLNPSIETKLELCKKVGLPVKPGMTPDQINKLLEYARESRKYAIRLAEIECDRMEVLDRKQRSKFGDDLVDELQHWKKKVTEGHYLIIYRNATGVTVDVAAIESVCIKPDEKPYIQVRMALPLQATDDDGADYLVWGNDESIRPSQILHTARLKSELDPKDLESYSRLVAMGERTAEKLRY